MSQQVIYKYELTPKDRFELALPEDANILTAQVDRKTGNPVIWIKRDADIETPLISREFAMLSTGHVFDQDNLHYEYIATVQFYSGQLILHLFEITL